MTITTPARPPPPGDVADAAPGAAPEADAEAPLDAPSSELAGTYGDIDLIPSPARSRMRMPAAISHCAPLGDKPGSTLANGNGGAPAGATTMGS